MIKLYHYNGTKLKDFYMGPSVKFVLPIIDAFPDKIMGVIFCVAKKDTKGGGVSEGVLFFRRNFSRLSFLNISLSAHTPNSSTSFKWWLKNRNSYVMYCGVS